MIANYHTHTWRCNHAEGTEEEYVSAALERGLQILGFSDHAPYPFPPPYVSSFRMKMEQYGDYIQTISELKSRYADRIWIHMGLETEFYPKFFPELRAFLRDSPLEYLILGQHYIGNEIEDHYSGAVTSDPADLKAYCHQAMDAMQTGCFTYFAHPDLLHFVGKSKDYRKYMGEMCREARACGIPVEINLLGVRQERWYPHEEFWEIAAEAGCQAVLGMDAHAPWHILEPYSEQEGIALAREKGIALLPQVELRPIL